MKPRFAGLCLLLLLCSCSRIKLAYNFADFLISSRTHKYLDLDSTQNKALKGEIKSYLSWHRKQMLPAYASACRKLALGFKGGEAADKNIAEVTALMGELYAGTMEPMVYPAAKLLAGLSGEQVGYLRQALEKDIQEQKKKYLSDLKVSEKRRLDRSVAYVEDFCGSLTDEQEKKIRELTLAVHVPTQAWIDDRQRRSTELLDLLDKKKGEPELQAALKGWWLRGRMAESAKGDPTRMDPVQVRDYFLGVLAVLTPEQRHKAAERFEGYAASFEELANNP